MDVERVREDFPILGQQVHGHPLVYLDNSATTQVPEQVLSTVAEHVSDEQRERASWDALSGACLDRRA